MYSVGLLSRNGITCFYTPVQSHPSASTVFLVCLAIEKLRADLTLNPIAPHSGQDSTYQAERVTISDDDSSQANGLIAGDLRTAFGSPPRASVLMSS
jgi:hypothetical protein